MSWESNTLRQALREELPEYNFDALEIFPSNSPQIVAPLRADKITVIGTGVLGKATKYRMVNKRRSYYGTYSCAAYLNWIYFSDTQYNQEEFEKVLREAVTRCPDKPAGETKPAAEKKTPKKRVVSGGMGSIGKLKGRCASALVRFWSEMDVPEDDTIGKYVIVTLRILRYERLQRVRHAAGKDGFLGLNVGGNEFWISPQPIPKPAKFTCFGRRGGDDVDVKQEHRAVVKHRSRPHRSVFGKWVTGRLPLEAKRIESIPCRFQLAIWVRQHQINDAFPSTLRYGRAADVFHGDIGQDGLNAPCYSLGYLGGPWVIFPAHGLSALIGTDDAIDLRHLFASPLHFNGLFAPSFLLAHWTVWPPLLKLSIAFSRSAAFTSK